MAPRKPAVKPATEAPAKKKRAAPAKLTPDQWKAMRIRYESDPDVTLEELGKEFGPTQWTIAKRVTAEGWKRIDPTNLKGMSKAALEEYQKRRAKLGICSEDELNALADEITAEFAAVARAELLEKHQKEWNAPRQLAYEAIQKKDFELAKLAKITSETLTNTQNGERKAWGLDKGVGNETNIRVVIERG